MALFMCQISFCSPKEWPELKSSAAESMNKTDEGDREGARESNLHIG